MQSYKIYRIIADANDGTDRFLCYIGSSTKDLSERLNGHEREMRRWKAGKHHKVNSFDVLSQGHYEIALIADLGEVSKEDAFREEGAAILKYRLDPDYIVVNRYMMGTPREYDERNREAINARKRQRVVCQVCQQEYRRNDRAEHMRRNHQANE